MAKRESKVDKEVKRICGLVPDPYRCDVVRVGAVSTVRVLDANDELVGRFVLSASGLRVRAYDPAWRALVLSLGFEV
uniref:Uncharacterized protein n=1 Tax=viral metagenome TaxID=1070528 RepID=A0A6M3L477_9ZZZZ